MPLPEDNRLAATRLIPWLAAGQPFPAPESAWSLTDPAPGLLAAGGALDVATLVRAYSAGIFPWFSLGQPVLWWSPEPRMVLQTACFRLHRSLRKKLLQFSRDASCEIRFDSAFGQVIGACASKPREGQLGTWIVPEMVRAYRRLHLSGYAHSVETWVNGRLVGGLYCVNLGRMIFGESMFADQTDASKIALAALIAFSRASQITMIDCQQNTGHLASLGAAEIGRDELAIHLSQNVDKAAPVWQFDPVCWDHLLVPAPPATPLIL